jgi:hypothetical protein
MCWSLEISLFTFVLILSLSVIVYYRGNQNDKWLGSFFMFVAFIQLFEALIWYSASLTNKDKAEMINHINTVLLFIFIGFQPFILTVASLQEDYIRKKYLNLIFLLMFLNVVFLIEWFSFFPSTKVTTDPNICNNHLQWNWLPPKWLCLCWVLLIVAPLLLLEGLYYKLISIMYLFGTLLVSMFFFKNTSASIFCWLSFLGIGVVSVLGGIQPPL